MQIYEIFPYQRMASLTGSAAGALTQSQPDPNAVTPGQSRRVALAMTSPAVKQQAAAAKGAWAQMVQAELNKNNVADLRKLPAGVLFQLLKNYTESSLLGGQVAIKQLKAPLPALLDQSIETIVNNSEDMANPSLTAAFETLARYSQAALASNAFAGPTGPTARREDANSADADEQESQQLQQAFETEINRIRSMGRNYPEPITATPNKLINAIAKGIGVLK
jgi:hypothetical protein